MKNNNLGFKRHLITPSFFGEYKIPKNVCEEIIGFFEMNQHRHEQGSVGYGVRKDMKDSTDLAIYPNEAIYQKYTSCLMPVVEKYIKEYGFAGYFDFWESGVINIQKYLPGQGFHAWHAERTRGVEPAVSRHLVFNTYLNDVYDGGETEFFYQRKKFKARAGKTLIWPADWTHTHRGVTSPTETKYIITGWFNYVQS